MLQLIRARRAAPSLLALLLFAGCDSILGPDDSRDLSRSRRLWENVGYSDYTYVVSNDCFCVMGGIPVEVTVRNRQVVSVVLAATGAPVATDIARLYHTVDGLFDVIDDAIRQHAHRVSAEYDPVYGFPTTVFIDYQANAVDEEFGFRVSALTPYR